MANSFRSLFPMAVVAGFIMALASTASAQNWASWRGPEHNGISRETNLLDSWSFKDNKNIIWQADTGGRSTPIVLNGRVYINCRTADNPALPDERIHIQE